MAFPYEKCTKAEINLDNTEYTRAVQRAFSIRRQATIDLVLRVLEESIDGMKMALILPKILSDPKNLKTRLSFTKYAPAVNVVDEFLRRRDIIVKDKIPPLMDHGMIKLLDYFHQNYKMYAFFPKFITEMNSREKELVHAMEMLLECAKIHMPRTAKHEIKQERILFKMNKENEFNESNVYWLQYDLRRQLAVQRWKAATKEVVLIGREIKYDEMERERARDMREEMETRVREFQAREKFLTEQKTELLELLEVSRIEREKNRSRHLQRQAELRSEKNKFLLQLQGMIKKYDTNISEKKREILIVEDQYKEAKHSVGEVRAIYIKEKMVFEEVVEHWEEEKRRHLMNRVLLFMMNRAARKIQLYWFKWRKEQRKRAKMYAKENKKKKD